MNQRWHIIYCDEQMDPCPVTEFIEKCHPKHQVKILRFLNLLEEPHRCKSRRAPPKVRRQGYAVVALYCEPLPTKDLEPSDFPDGPLTRGP